MKREFMKGDKVRVARQPSYYFAEASEGAEGVVTSFDWTDDEGRSVFVRLTKSSDNADCEGDGVGDTYSYDPADLELIVETPVPKFHVGQRVKVVKNRRIATVERVVMTRDGVTYFVQYGDGDCGWTSDLAPAPTTHSRTWRKPDGFAHIDQATINRWADEIDDEDTRSSGDALMQRLGDRVYVYRLEAISDDE